MLKEQNITGNGKRSSDDSDCPSPHSKRQRTEPSSKASSPGTANNSVLLLSNGRKADHNGPTDVKSKIAMSQACTPRRKLKPARKSCLSTPITRWLTAVPSKDQDTPRQAQQDLSTIPPVSIPKKLSRQRRKKPASKQEDHLNDPPADFPTAPAHNTPGGDLEILFSARKRQSKKTSPEEQDPSTSVVNGCTSKEPAPSPPMIQLGTTSCDGVQAKK